MKRRTILKNAARCRLCKTEIESKHVHDWVACSCGAIFVDGGHDYQRWGGNRENFESLSELGPEEYDEAECLGEPEAGRVDL